MKKNGNNNGNADFQQVAHLMREMGSKRGFDPMPPDQHSWPQMNGHPPLFKLWSWMCGHTIARQANGRRSPWAVDERGRRLTIEDAAADLEMDPGVTRRAWREGRAIGVWRQGEDRRLYLNGQLQPEATETLDEEGEEKGNEKGLYKFVPPYILLQIKNLPKDKRKLFLEKFQAQQATAKQVHADLTAALRLITDQQEDNLFSEFGIKKVRERYNSHKKEKARADGRQERLEGIREFVQTFFDFVQTLENVSVQPALNKEAEIQREDRGFSSSLSDSVQSSTTTTTPPAGPPEPPEPPKTPETLLGKTLAQEAEEVRQSMARYAPADPEAGSALLERCRREAPECTPSEIAEFVAQKAAVLQDMSRAIGFFLKAVPKCFIGNYRPRLKESPAPRNGPISTRLQKTIEENAVSLQFAKAFSRSIK